MRNSAALVVLAASCLAACGKADQPVLEGLLCDPSSSSICDVTAVRAAAESFLSENNPPGSIFEAWTLGCDVGDVTKVISIKVPLTWGKGVAKRRREWQQTERARLKELTLPPTTRCSAVSAGIWSIGRLIKERSGFTPRFTLLSDLREVYGPFNFERRIPAPKQFVDWLRKKNLLADLRGVEVRVCLVHNGRTPDSPSWNAKMSQQRDDAWTAAFEAMGAPGVRLTESCPFVPGHSDLVAGGAVP
jgi:hypothetical protein